MQKFYCFLAAILLPFSASAEGVYYTIDNSQTHVKFSVKMCQADLLMGEFADVKGKIYFDEAKPEASWAEVEIQAKSAAYDKEFHKEDKIKDIIDSDKIASLDKFPLIHFKSTKIEPTSDFTAMMTGDMTFHGITKPLTMEVTFKKDEGMTAEGRTLAAFAAYGTFKRSEWGVDYGLDRIGIRKMGDDITLLISTAATRDPK